MLGINYQLLGNLLLLPAITDQVAGGPRHNTVSDL